MVWHFRDRSVEFSRPLAMGIVNVPPASSWDGARYSTTQAAIDHGLRLAADGADFLDVGGELSRPGATPISLAEELDRVVPVVRGLVGRTGVPISVDTTTGDVARQALAAGAHIINDIS